MSEPHCCFKYNAVNISCDIIDNNAQVGIQAVKKVKFYSAAC